MRDSSRRRAASTSARLRSANRMPIWDAHVAVIGGGDNAFDVSRMLAERGVRVTLVMRSRSPKAQPLLVERLRPHQASGMAR